ncbi:competence pheromone ComX [Gracilibacillus lacisalsi]|uniref:competence pheromone ComX n=1 Tax=Gracilibacillus lacisalsi TaxID=393087 RepID=UPI000376979C|nr:competence pheromone ComX [Gracilibacillus lacisalsi]
MQATILYLSQNPDIMEKIKRGKASLLGVTQKENKAITEYLKSSSDPVVQYWT